VGKTYVGIAFGVSVVREGYLLLSNSFIDHMIGIIVIEANDGFSLRDGCIVAKCSEKLESSQKIGPSCQSSAGESRGSPEMPEAP
jgi:hypothetical protein